LIGVQEVFDGCPGYIFFGVLKIFDWVSWKYLMGVLQIIDGCLSDI